MKDRFDLESDINNLYTIQDSLKLLAENVIENNLSTDDIANVLLGLETILSLHVERLHDTFSQAFKLDEYRTNTEQVFKEVGNSINKYLDKEDETETQTAEKKIPKKSPKKKTKRSV